MNWGSVSTVALVLFAAPVASALAESAKVRGGYGCDRKSEGAICFPEECRCGFYIAIEGEIDAPTVDKVKELFDARRSQAPVDEGFSINSRGGNVASAMAIGRMFRKERAWLSVDGDCVSACIFVLAGAIDRIIVNSARVGIHRPYAIRIDPSFSTDKVREAYRAALQQIRSYLREMNVSERLADDMLAIEPEKVRFLTNAELARYRLLGLDRGEQETRAIENEIRDVEDANRLRLDRREYTRRKTLGDARCSALPRRESAACKLRILKTGQ
jgi:ATP-dependent protease ClpP protease subunit